MWELGWTDGRVDQQLDHGEGVLSARAELGRITTDLAHKQKAARLGELTRELEKQEILAAQRLNSLETHLNELEVEKRERPGHFSLTNGVINIFVALVVLLADVPLSLSLVATGFGVRTSDGDLSVEDILSQPREVLQNFWEAALLCAGVALLGMFFKLLCEDLLDAAVRSPQWQKFYRVFMLSVGLVLLVTIFYLGLLRSQANEAIRVYSAAEKQEEQTNSAGTGSLSKTEKVNLPAELPSFILLAVVFPVVGGVSFAVGWRKCQNFSSLRHTQKGAAKAEKRLHLIRHELAHTRAEAEAWQSLSVQEVSKRLEELWQNLYAHGYERGRRVPETLHSRASIYERFERSFHRLLAASMR